MKKILLSTIVGFCLLILTQNVSAGVFSDVASDHKNYKAITYLHDKGVIEGYKDNSFRPNQKVNRAEALKIILLGSKIFVPELQKQSIFPDVFYDTWYGKYVAKARNLKIVKGDDDTGYFRPGDTVNLAEILKILLKANNKKTVPPKNNPYQDVSKNAWYGPYFKYASGANLLDASYKDNVNPATSITRGMLAELIYRLINSTYIEPDGEASFYGKIFHGRTTANGEKFDMNAMTAAHRTYAFDTWLKVTNVANGKSVVVKINDRGPYAGHNRIIDLSEAAFAEIASKSTGIIEVKLDVTTAPNKENKTDTSSSSTSLNEPTPSSSASISSAPSTSTSITGDTLNSTKVKCADIPPKYAKITTFGSITLENELQTSVLLNEVLTLKGTTTSSKNKVTAFIVDSNDKQTAFTASVNQGSFAVDVRFPKAGTFKLGVLPGESGDSSAINIKVLENTCIAESEDATLNVVTGLSVDLKDGDTVVKWSKGDYNLFRVTFIQEGLEKSYILNNLSNWSPVYKEFESFKVNTNVVVNIRGAKFTKKSILEMDKIVWSKSVQKSFMPTTHHDYIVNSTEIDLLDLTQDAALEDSIKTTLKGKTSIRSSASIILPNGKVTEVAVTSTNSTPSKNSNDVVVFSASDNLLSVSYATKAKGVHFLEVNNAEGLAVINTPIYVKGEFPLIPNPRDLSYKSSTNLNINTSQAKNKMLTLVNNDRKKYGLKELVLDTKLSSLAQARGDDMANNDYFGHWDKQGKNADDIRMNYGIQTFVGENLAQDVSTELAEHGLMRSAIHRSNILSADWTRVGFGVSKAKSGSYIFVQIFSTDPIELSDVSTLRSQMMTEVNKNRTSDLILQTNLNSVTQSWSQKMADEDFFAFTDKSGTSLVDTARNAGVKSSMGTYIMGNSSFSDVLKQLSKNTQVQDSKWKSLGIGVVQDKLGIIKITLIYTE